MNPLTIRVWLQLGIATSVAGMCAVASGTVTEVAPADQVQFAQKTIAAQMQELQDRMFKLSETSRQLEPDDSAKLILAVQRAREELIVEQMKDVMESLGRRELSKAADDQRQVLVKLETLKQLLLNSDLDLQSQLQQLRKLDAALKKIDAITKQEQAQRTQAALQAKLQTPEQPKLAAMKQDQENTKLSTDGVAQSTQTLGEAGSGASKSLSGASSKMGSASKHLGGQKPGDALASQDGAIEDLKAARDQLEAAREKLMAELERQVRKQVIANLSDMLERQRGVREAEQSFGSAAEAGEREAGLSVRRLATAEQRIVTINDQTLELIQQTQFSLALPPALQDIGTRCVYLQSDLAAGKTGAKVVDASIRIEKDLASLIETFKELSSATTPSNCKGGCKDQNKLLAELKVLRLLQVRVNQETLDVDGERAAVAELSPELRSKVTTAHDHEASAHDVADKIYKALTAE